jgi:hypothetical protein
MNCRDAYAESTVHGYIGWVRLDWKAEPFEVRIDNKDGPVAYFRSATEAELAAWRLKHKIETKTMRREGDTLSTSNEVNIVFAKFAKQPTILRQKGKTRLTQVVRRARA